MRTQRKIRLEICWQAIGVVWFYQVYGLYGWVLFQLLFFIYLLLRRTYNSLPFLDNLRLLKHGSPTLRRFRHVINRVYCFGFALLGENSWHFISFGASRAQNRLFFLKVITNFCLRPVLCRYFLSLFHLWILRYLCCYGFITSF